MHIDRLDHFVLTVTNVEATCEFYSRVPGMQVVTFGNGRKALQFGQQKINLHQRGQEIDPKATKPTAGSGDFCLITSLRLDRVLAHLRDCNVVIEDGPVARIGAVGPFDRLGSSVATHVSGNESPCRTMFLLKKLPVQISRSL